MTVEQITEQIATLVAKLQVLKKQQVKYQYGDTVYVRIGNEIATCRTMINDLYRKLDNIQ